MKKFYKFLGIIAIGVVIGFTLAGCKDTNSGGGSCPNEYDPTCWYRGNDDFSICGQESCAVVRDHRASCNCGN
jgi:predicted small secreted protein